jgi:hypothetical protein
MLARARKAAAAQRKAQEDETGAPAPNPRWANRTPEERSAHMRMMVAARRRKAAQRETGAPGRKRA